MENRPAQMTSNPKAELAFGKNPMQRFRLVRYFTLASLAAFAAVAIGLYLLERSEQKFFDQVQDTQRVFLQKVQSELSNRQAQVAVENLSRLHEAGHVNTTRVFMNVLWDSTFAPLIAHVQNLPIEPCRELTPEASTVTGAGKPDDRKICLDKLRTGITSYRGFANLHNQVIAAMRKTTAFKIKVYDMRGLTVYSSEHSQIGEDKVQNEGWKIAAGGQPASELTHRDRFSAFEGVVENRDLFSTYVPARAPGSDEIVGVFEIYSDVTPFLQQIRTAATVRSELNAQNQATVERVATQNQQQVAANAEKLWLIIGSLLALLYVALLLIVRYGQHVIDQQALVHERAILRESLWHREKMAALATMAANIAHNVGNPLATISLLAQEIGKQYKQGDSAITESQEILTQTRRIAAMTHRMAEFVAAHSETPQLVDLNQMVKAVCDFMSFDQRLRRTKIDFRPATGLPGCVVVPDWLNEALMALLQGSAKEAVGTLPPPERVLVQTGVEGNQIYIRISFEPMAAEESPGDPLSPATFEDVERQADRVGGRLVRSGATIAMFLPLSAAESPKN